jgi:hypothetical protein
MKKKIMTNFSKCHSSGGVTFLCFAAVPYAAKRIKSMPEVNETSQTDMNKEMKKKKI